MAVGSTANFCFDLPARILVDGMEAVVVLIAFRRFAQFPGNERQRARSGEEKGCGYDHDQSFSMICAIIDGSDLFRAKLRFRVFLIRELTRGTPSATECARPANSFSRLCHAESLSAQSVRF